MEDVDYEDDVGCVVMPTTWSTVARVRNIIGKMVDVEDDDGRIMDAVWLEV